MLSRKRLGLVAAFASMARAGVVAAQAPTLQEQGPLSLSNPIYAAASAPRRPIMSLLDRVDMAAGLEQNNITIGGWVEGGWNYNFNNSNVANAKVNNNAGHFFDEEEQDPTLNQVVLFLDKRVIASGEKFDFGGRFEYMWGGDARRIHAHGVMDNVSANNGPDEQFDLTQLYLQMNIPVANGLVVTAGKFVTPFGYETVNPTTTPLYSRSFLFAFSLPRTLTGVTAKYAFDQNWSAMIGVVRGWDQSLQDFNDSHSYMGQIAYTSRSIDATLSLLSGPERFDNEQDWRTLVDATVVWRLDDQFTFAANADVGREEHAAINDDAGGWYGIAGYAMYKCNDMFTFVGRIERLTDNDGARTGIKTTLFEATLGVQIHPFPNNEWGSNLLIRPEIRYDTCHDSVFNRGRDNNQTIFAIDAVILL